MRGVVVLCALAACGRMGFEGGHARPESTKPDGGAVPDADPSIDAAVGMGSYDLTESTAPYALLDGAASVPNFVPGSDEDLHAIALPFTFVYYGVPYTTVFAHTNGYATFGAPVSGEEAYLNDCPFADGLPDATIALFWDDLFASKTIEPFGTIRYLAARTHVEIEWRDVDAYYRAGGGNNFFSHGIRTTQKLVLHATGKIEMH